MKLHVFRALFITNLLLLMIFAGCTLLGSPAVTSKNSKSFYIKSLEELVEKQAKAKTVTAKIITDARFPKLTNVTSGYFLTEIISRLDQMPKAEEAGFQTWVMENAEELPPPFLMELGHIKFLTNKQEGLKWYVIGRVRAGYDAKRCKDPRAFETPLITLLQRHKELILFAMANKDDFLKAQEMALNWDEEHSNHASPVWMCASTLDAVKFVSEVPQPVPVETLLLPEESWPAIKAELHTEIEKDIEKQKTQ